MVDVHRIYCDVRIHIVIMSPRYMLDCALFFDFKHRFGVGQPSMVRAHAPRRGDWSRQYCERSKFSRVERLQSWLTPGVQRPIWY